MAQKKRKKLKKKIRATAGTAALTPPTKEDLIMENQSFMSSIIDSIRTTVNNFALNRLQDSGRFNADDAYYSMHEYGGTLGEYASNTFFGQLFSKKSWLS